ncbi:hypothetical protein PEC301879_23770 [Pectobacterium carotovorum subsp. carotovorum]|nr:hypothetical protein PEC301879_23770 [Pectobacterium carotovorum subsp. carotovorum]
MSPQPIRDIETACTLPFILVLDMFLAAIQAR